MKIHSLKSTLALALWAGATLALGQVPPNLVGPFNPEVNQPYRGMLGEYLKSCSAPRARVGLAGRWP